MSLTRSLAEAAPGLARILKGSQILTPREYPPSSIRTETLKVAARDGIRLATDIYFPPRLPAPAIVMRTPYGRGDDRFVGAFLFFARRGYVVLAQDCRGTGDSEPAEWDYYVYEPEDGYDLIEWVSRQTWFGGFLGSIGSSYAAQTQWPMALHRRMSALVPEVSGLGVARNSVHLHMFLNAYARSLGKGATKGSVPYGELEAQMLQETLSSGCYNEPLQKPLPAPLLERFPSLRDLRHTQAQRWLWEHYCALSCAGRAELLRTALGVSHVSILEIESASELFGPQIPHDAHTLPHAQPAELLGTMHTPVMLRTGWYDWGLNDTLATWDLLMRAAPEAMRARCRLIITPSAHNTPGYHEGMGEHPELQHAHGGLSTNLELLLRWFSAIREGTIAHWPRVIYYLMGAHEWRFAEGWPVPGACTVILYCAAKGGLSVEHPSAPSAADVYTYEPQDPTPTVGGSIVSSVYSPGSVDVSHVQRRSDVLTYSTPPLSDDLDVVGPLRMILYASSSAVDTDFAARLTDVFPDGRAIQLQNGVLRARYRNLDGEPELLEPGRIYRFEVDMWATANRFKAGHRLRVDVSSADFPRFDRNSNRGGEPGDPIPARQTIHHDPEHPSHLVLSVLGEGSFLK